MSNKKLMILGIVAALFVIWAVVQSNISNKPGTVSDIQAPLIQGFDPVEIGSIVLGTDKNAVTLKRDQGRFVVVSKDNYHAVTSKINDLITSCLDIRTVELYTDNPANHKDLGVTEENARNVIKFLKPDSQLLVGIVIGRETELGQGTFIRLLSSDKVYVTLDAPWIRDQAMDYIDQELISVKREDVEAVTISCPNEVYTLKTSEENQSITLENLPEGKKLKSGVADGVFTALANLSFDDVEKQSAAKKELTFDNQFVCRLKNSTVYTVKIARKDSKTHVTCDAQFTDKTPVTKTQGQVESEEELKKKESKLLARDKAEEFSEEHREWVYQISDYKAKNLTKKLSDLIEDEKKPDVKSEEKPKEEPGETEQPSEPNSNVTEEKE